MPNSFMTIATKYLSEVEISSSSNQHEFQGVSSLRTMFGYQRQDDLMAEFAYYGNNAISHQAIGYVSWYNCRENNPSRSPEYRLYYSEDNAVRRANVGDLLVIGRRHNNSVVVMIVENGSSYHSLFRNLFGI